MQVKQQLAALQQLASSVEQLKQQLGAETEQVHQLQREYQQLQVQSCSTEQLLDEANAARKQLQLELEQVNQAHSLDLQQRRYAMHSQQCSLTVACARSHQVILPANVPACELGRLLILA